MASIGFSVPTSLTVTGATTLSATVASLLRVDAGGVVSTTSLSSAFALSVGGALTLTGSITSAGLTMASARMLGRTTASSGAIEEITISTGLTLTTATLTIDSTVATLAGVQALTNKTYNGNTWTAGTGVLTMAASKTLTVSNTLTFTGTDSSSVAFGAGGTVLYSGGAYVSSITGTANQITASASTGAVTLSLPTALTSVNSITAAAATDWQASGGSSGATLSLATLSGGNASVTITPRGDGLVQVYGSATSAQARLNITMLKAGVAEVQESTVSFEGALSNGANTQLGSINAVWVNAAPGTAYSCIALHANDLAGLGSNNALRVYSQAISIFSSTYTRPAAGTLEVNGTLNMKGTITTNNSYTATYGAPVVSLVSNDASFFAQFQAASSVNRALVFGAFGDSRAGTTFGQANSSAAYITSSTLGANYPDKLLIGTTGRTASVYIGTNDTLAITVSGTNQAVTLAATTASTSTTTGALVVSGGAGVTGTLWALNLVVTPGTTTYQATTDLDFTGASGLTTISLTGNLTLTSSGRVAGRGKVIRLVCDGTARTLTFPAGWMFLGGGTPTSIASGKTAILSVTFFGSADTDAVCAYSVQP